MLHLGTIALSALLVLCSAAAPASLFGEKKENASIAYEDTASINGTSEDVTLPYLSRTVISSHSLALMYPSYNYSPAVGSCGCIAGANILGFYDRYDENLIPDHKSGTQYESTYLYSMEDSAVVKVIETLYEYMGTEHVGTTENEFINGMKRYCNEKGKTISFTSCMSSNSLNFLSAQSMLKANQPIVLFLSGYNTADITMRDNQDTIHYWISEANHIMIAFGYEIFSYATSSGNTRFEYFEVAPGLSGVIQTYFDINYKTKINDALAVNIY